MPNPILATIFILTFLIILSFVYASLRGAPWVPTRKKDIDRFLKLAKIKKGDKMYDLGCGDGRLVCAAAKVGAKAEGFELSILMYLVSKTRSLFQKNRSKIKIHYKNIWKLDLSQADIIYCFLMPEIYPKLKEKLEKEAKTGAKIITYVWPIKEWKASKTNKEKGYSDMFLYEMK